MGSVGIGKLMLKGERGRRNGEFVTCVGSNVGVGAIMNL